MACTNTSHKRWGRTRLQRARLMISRISDLADRQACFLQSALLVRAAAFVALTIGSISMDWLALGARRP